MGAPAIDAKHAPGRAGLTVALLVTAAMGTFIAARAEAQIPTVNPSRAPDTPARATSAIQPPAEAADSSTATRILLEQATYWRSQYQPEQAMESLSRMLRLDKNNADALAMLASIQAELGQSQAARESLRRLRAAYPNDPRIGAVEQSLMTGELDQAQLAEARRLAGQGGNSTEAVKAYQRVFKGDTPPLALAIEYYQTLGGSVGGFDQAHDALARIVTQNPQDLRAQFAFAQLQTFRESTRLEGIRRLEALVAKPAIAEQASQALKDALAWLPNDTASLDALDAYLRDNPDDADLKAKRELVRNPPGKARQAGFDALEKNRISEAEAGFLNALTLDPTDKDALGGLGLVRQRQGRLPEARELLGRAAQIDPGWEPALGGANFAPANLATGRNGSGRGDNAAGRAIAARYAQVNIFARNGQSAQAEALLARLMGRDGNWGNYLQLGALQAEQGKLTEAESSLRRAMRMNPRNSAAAISLAGVLQLENRGDEARQLLAQVGVAPGAGGGALGRVADLRRQAQAETDPELRVSLLQQAVADDPSFPWARLDLARALDAQNRHPEARQVMDGAVSGARPSRDQVQAGLIYAREQGDIVRAGQLVQLLPAKDRTPEMRSLQQQAALRTEIDGAMAGGDGAVARARMLQIAAQPDPTGTRAPEIAKRLLAMNDKVGAREAIRAALANTRPQTSAQQLAYVGPLLDAGYRRDATALAAAVDPSSLDPLQRTALEGTRNGLAIQQSDALNQQGKRAAAYDALAPRLASKPNAPDLNMALGRLYASDKKPEQALRINEAVLERDPGDLDTRRAAVGSAIQAGDFNHADGLIATAEQQAPDDYRTQLMIADMARARGNPGRALAALRHARELRLQQVGGVTGG